MTNILDEALTLHRAGYAPIRASTDGQKRPLGKWEQHQAGRPSEDEVAEWFRSGHHGIGIVCGQVSGNAEMLEFEGRAVDEGILDEWTDIMDASGLDGLRERLRGWVEQSPSGGYHIHYRVDGHPVPGNTKLARRPATADELAVNPEKVKVLVETRGEGGFVVTAPSNGTTHPSGKPWVRISGGPGTAPVLTAEEHDALYSVCRMLDRMPAVAPQPTWAATVEAGGRPGDDYNARAAWGEILTGWTPVYTRGSVTYWRRPGKSIGVSATTGRNEADNLYVFSSSTEFDTERPYSKFAAYTLLEHRGDYSTAAKALRSKGYGDDSGGPGVAAIAAIPAEWPDPVPLGQTYPPPLPVDCCGPILSPLVKAVAEEYQVPSDLVVNMILSIVSTAAQGFRVVRVNRAWTEILSISSTSIAASGERKSPILRILSTVLEEVERELRDQAAPQVRRREEEIKLAEARITDARNVAKKDPLKEAALHAEIDVRDQLQELHHPRLLADDATPEALLEVLEKQRGTIGVVSAEPGFFATLAGRYSDGVANLDGVLKATSGEPIRVDRKKVEPLIIQNPCLTISVCMQPGLLEQLQRKPELRHTGFLARFLYVRPEPKVGYRVLSTLSTTAIKCGFEDYLSIYNRHIHSLAHHSYSRNQYSQSSELPLSEAAAAVFHQFRIDLEPRLRGDLEDIADWGGKLPGTVARLAGIMTVLEDPDAEQIEEPTMYDAIQLGEAYIPHALNVLNAMRGQGDEYAHARDVLRVITKHAQPTVSVRDISQSLRNTGWVKEHRGRPADAIEEQLDLLADFGHVRPLPEEERSGAGRKPSPRYEVNPIHLETP